VGCCVDLTAAAGASGSNDIHTAMCLSCGESWLTIMAADQWSLLLLECAAPGWVGLGSIRLLAACFSQGSVSPVLPSCCQLAACTAKAPTCKSSRHSSAELAGSQCHPPQASHLVGWHRQRCWGTPGCQSRAQHAPGSTSALAATSCPPLLPPASHRESLAYSLCVQDGRQVLRVCRTAHRV
jgi:hypothetical protein